MNLAKDQFGWLLVGKRQEYKIVAFHCKLAIENTFRSDARQAQVTAIAACDLREVADDKNVN